jgi:hypothetical protein
LDFTGLAGFSYYKLIASNLVPATNAAKFAIVVGSGSTTWQTGSNYRWAYHLTGVAGGDGSSSSASATSWQPQLGVLNTGDGMSMDFTIVGSSAGYHIMGTLFETDASGGNAYWVGFGGRFGNSVTLTGIRIITDGGNIKTGQASLWGKVS